MHLLITVLNWKLTCEMRLLNSIVEKNIVSRTWLFTDFAHNGSHVDTLKLFREIRMSNLGIKYISSNTFLYCNLVLDTTVALAVIQSRYGWNEGGDGLEKRDDKMTLIFYPGGCNLVQLLLIAKPTMSFLDQTKEHNYIL